MRSLTKCNLPNMNHPDENSPSNNKLLWGEKNVFISDQKDAGSWGKERGGVLGKRA